MTTSLLLPYYPYYYSSYSHSYIYYEFGIQSSLASKSRPQLFISLLFSLKILAVAVNRGFKVWDEGYQLEPGWTSVYQLSPKP